MAADLVAADLVAADLVPGPASPGARLVARRPRRLVRAPWCVIENENHSHLPLPRGPKKRAGSLAARALALFHTVSFT